MLFDRVSALAERARDYQLKKELVTEAKRFETRAKQLAAPTAEWVQVYALAAEFRSEGLEVDLAASPADVVATQAAAFLAAFNADHKALLDPDEIFAHQFVPTLKKVVLDHRNLLLAAWHDFVDAQFTQLPESVLQAVATISSYRRQVELIQAHHQEVVRLRASLPSLETVASTIERVKKLAAGKNAAMGELLGGGIPDEVVEFLAQAGSTGFSLARLTPAIDEWLRERGLLGAFWIRSA
jgi:hypothetical protein